MRKAAGIILIVSGILGVIGVVMSLTGISVDLVPYLHLILARIASAAVLVSGGVFCLRRRYWRACLATAVAALFIGLFSTIDYVRYIAAIRAGLHYHSGAITVDWGTWIVLLAGVISVVFICLKKKEWQEISDSVDGKVSYGG